MGYSYRFTGAEARVFADLTHCDTCSVERDGAVLTDADGQPLDNTVVLEPGDLLRSDRPVDHFELEPADAETTAAHAHEPESPPARKSTRRTSRADQE